MQAPSVRAAVDAARIDTDFSMVAGLDAPALAALLDARRAAGAPASLLVITPTGRRAESIGAALESLIGLGLLTGRYLRLTLLMLGMQMLGTLAPLFLFPEQTFASFPFVPTLEGQYILKNVVLIAGAMVVGSTVRGGRLTPED